MKEFLTKPRSGRFMTLVHIGAFAFIALVTASIIGWYIASSSTTTSFISPSGDNKFIVVESCDSIACNQAAALTNATEWLNCNLHSQWDGIHFEDAIVEWSEDEQTIYWKFAGDDSFNQIVIETDCE